ncbi:MAG: TraB/GumN family protein [Treponema sp.]|nr:TraB/GumN family protein [Treponema sp.]
MSSNNIRLDLGGRDIRLIGTAHISRESIEEVTNAIRDEKPAMVCVELDEGRYASINQNDTWAKLNVSKVLREGKGFLLIANIVLASFQRRLGNEIGVKPGEEMIAAVNTAKEMGIEFSLCDREVQVTLRRAWARCSLWSKNKLLAALFSSAFAGEKLSAAEIEKLKQSNELDNMMKELSDYLPAVKETLIDERDRYLATKIWTAAGKVSGKADGAGTESAGTIAVVGAGHLHGIQIWLEKFAADEAAGKGVESLDELETIPPKTLFSKCIKWVIPAVIVSFLVAGFLRADTSHVLDMLQRWILWNSGGAALGSILALGHPLAILSAILAAPFTVFFGPFMSSGILAGLVQAVVRKPRVLDAETISRDIASLKGLYRNRITKVLLVFFLTNIGSALATWPALGSIAGLWMRSPYAGP